MCEMTILRLGGGSSRFRAMMVEQEEWEQWRELDATRSLAAAWRAPSIRFYKPGETGLSGDRRTKGVLSTETDMPMVFGCIMTVVSDRFVAVAGPALAKYGEFLPCRASEGCFYVYHCTTVLDALDESRSVVCRDESTGEIWDVSSYQFRPEIIPPGAAFRLSKGDPYSIFITGRLDAAIRQPALRGIMTERVT